MKALILKIIAFFLTFFIGFIVSTSWVFGKLPQIEIVPEFDFAPIETSVCAISDYSSDFNGKLISFKATAYAVDSELILFPINCVMSGDNYLSPTLEYRNYFGTHNNLISLLQTERPPSAKPDYTNFKEVDIRVIGIVKEFYDERGRKLYSVIPKKIQIISSFRQFEPKGAA
ncbi:MAG TPA: hypothetical protein VGC76_06045 [Pyrinomonadaceae bacterium]|jgi:hypothetical protein